MPEGMMERIADTLARESDRGLMMDEPIDGGTVYSVVLQRVADAIREAIHDAATPTPDREDGR